MDKIKNIDETKSSNNLIKIIKGSIISLVISAILLLIMAIVLTYTNISELIIPTAIIVITAVSILIGSTMSAMHIQKKGIINGAIVGLIYMTILYVLSSVTITGFSINYKTLIMFAAAIIGGIIGGIIGVNIKK